jgi:NADH-quinone oxidoreductase subunit L
MAQTCLLIVLLPLTAFVVQVFFGKRLPRHGDWVSILAIAGSLFLAAPIFFAFLKTGDIHDTLQTVWMSMPLQIQGHGQDFSLQIVVGTLVNNLTAIMLFMVTLCATLIHVFASGYMHGEPRYHLFFAYISLFSAAMLGLVVSDNLLTFFICWELMGLCSYALIGFYYEKPSANVASLKAFMTTRIGDCCFFLGICGLYFLFGTSNFEQIYQNLSMPELGTRTILGMPALAFVGFMLMMGTIGKSAQFPLHVWLPDAMEGPTPVSALIHAATMVAAGVFLLIRTFPLLQAAHIVLPVIAYVGAFTALFAATIALVQVDIKKVLAYSTISQLGFMVFGVGVGAFAAAFLHLLTHAVFKACLFLGSGSVIHSVHTNDMREMGGLRTKMPYTFATMLISTLAISGLPFFSGFVSKDRILAGALAFGMEHSNHMLIPIMGFTAAGLTAFYMFRLVYMTFFGHARDEHKHHHAHESSPVMTVPLMILAALSFSIWYAGPTGIEVFDKVLPVHWYDRGIENVMHSMHIEAHHGSEETHHLAHNLALILSLCIAGAGILLSSLMYLKKAISPDAIKAKMEPIHKVLWNKYYFDELYIGILIKKGLLTFNNFLARFDDLVIDRIVVDGWKDVAMVIKSFIGQFDNIVIDRGLVDGSGYAAAAGGWVFRQFQTGRVQTYLIWSLVVLGIYLFRVF